MGKDTANDTEQRREASLPTVAGSHSIGWMGSISDRESGHVNVHNGCASLSWGMMERLRKRFPEAKEFEVHISIRPTNPKATHEQRREND